MYTVCLQSVGTLRSDARGLDGTEDVSILVDAFLLKPEHVLHRDDITLHADDLREPGQSAFAVAEAG